MKKGKLIMAASNHWRFSVAFAVAIATSGTIVNTARADVTDLSVEGIEVTQGIQCFDQTTGYTSCADNSLELVFGKPIVVRVYLGHDHGVCPADNGLAPVVKGVKVVLRWAAYKPDLPSPVLPTVVEKSFDVPCLTNLQELRQSSEGAVTFIIPADDPGLIPTAQKQVFSAEAEVVPPMTMPDVPGNNIKKVELGDTEPGGIAAQPTLRVKGMFVDYRPDFGYAGPPFASADVVKGSAAQMKANFPMPVEYSTPFAYLVYGSHPQTGLSCGGCPDVRNDDAGTLVYMIEKALLYFEQLFGETKPDVLFGWLPEGADSDNPTVGWGQNPGTAAVCIEQTSMTRNNRCLAHEVGHTRGLNHTNEQTTCALDTRILEEGFNPFSAEVIPVTTFDFMDGRKGVSPTFATWVSPYGWNRLLGVPISSEWSACPASTSSLFGKQLELTPANAGPEPVMIVGGRVHLDGSGELDPVYRTSGNGPFPESDPAGEYCLDLQSSSGATLNSNCFSVSFTALETGAPTDTAYYVFKLRAGASQRIALRRGEDVLAVQQSSPHAPTSRITAPELGDMASGQMTIAWEASDDDGDALRHVVLYSHDGGGSASAIAVDVEGSRLEVDTTMMAGGDNALVRVLTSDGFNTTTAESALFEVVRKPPLVSIFSPAEATVVDATKELGLFGHAYDLEDGGELDDGSLTWESNRDGSSGSGSQLVLPPGSLSSGQHEIKLTATDSDQQAGMASVHVFVDQPPWADAGPNQQVECASPTGTQVTLDGSASSDPDVGDQLSFKWQDASGALVGESDVIELTLPSGSHPFVLTVKDEPGLTDQDTTTVTVEDTIPPAIDGLSANPSKLWPPNHKMRSVEVIPVVWDACDAAPICSVSSVSSNEVALGGGSGKTTPDWEITGDLTVDLRAERSGEGSGRVYTVEVDCADASGNVSTGVVSVAVPHNRRR